VIIFVGSDESVEELEVDEDPADSFPCLATGPLYRDARTQLYALVTGVFFDEAWDFEVLSYTLTEEGPWIYRLATELVEQLAELDEDTIGEYAELWLECEELESLDPDLSDLYDFLYHFVHLCRTALDGEDLGVFVYANS